MQKFPRLDGALEKHAEPKTNARCNTECSNETNKLSKIGFWQSESPLQFKCWFGTARHHNVTQLFRYYILHI